MKIPSFSFLFQFRKCSESPSFLQIFFQALPTLLQNSFPDLGSPQNSFRVLQFCKKYRHLVNNTHYRRTSIFKHQKSRIFKITRLLSNLPTILPRVHLNRMHFVSKYTTNGKINSLFPNPISKIAMRSDTLLGPVSRTPWKSSSVHGDGYPIKKRLDFLTDFGTLASDAICTRCNSHMEASAYGSISSIFQEPFKAGLQGRVARNEHAILTRWYVRSTLNSDTPFVTSRGTGVVTRNFTLIQSGYFLAARCIPPGMGRPV